MAKFKFKASATFEMDIEIEAEGIEQAEEKAIDAELSVSLLEKNNKKAWRFTNGIIPTSFDIEEWEYAGE